MPHKYPLMGGFDPLYWHWEFNKYGELFALLENLYLIQFDVEQLEIFSRGLQIISLTYSSN